MKKIGRINTLMLFFSAFVLICYLPYLGLVIARGESFKACAIPFAVVTAATVPAYLFVKYRARLPKLFKILRVIYIIGMCFYTVTFSAFSLYIGICSRSGVEEAAETLADAPADSKGDLILVLGCRTYGYTPGDQLKKRLDTAYELLAQNDNSICIVSGGEGSNEGVAEAYSMCKYLADRGIDSSRVYTEAESRNTYENIEYSKKIIEDAELEYDRIICVSSDFHIPRVRYLLDYYDLDAVTVAAPSRDAWQFFMSIVREYMAYVKLFLVTIV